MASNGGCAQKQEDAVVLEKNCKTYLNCIQEDGIRKELYKLEKNAQEIWDRKWGFLKNPRKLWEDEAAKRGLSKDIFDRRLNRFPSRLEQNVNSYNFTVQKFPALSSGMIGWKSTIAENNLDKIGGPMYISRRLTVNPPLGHDEPDLNLQRFIILG